MLQLSRLYIVILMNWLRETLVLQLRAELWKFSKLVYHSTPRIPNTKWIITKTKTSNVEIVLEAPGLITGVLLKILPSEILSQLNPIQS